MRQHLRWSDFPLEEYEHRVAKAASLMEEQGIDALLVTRQEENLRYLTGYKSCMCASKFRPQVALIPRDSSKTAALILSGREGINAEASWIEDVVFFNEKQAITEQIAEVIRAREFDKATIATELGFGQRLGMSLDQFESLRGLLPDVQWVDISPVISKLRMIKSPAEIEMVRRACQLTCQGIRAGWEALHEGMSERELAAVMCSTMIARGADFDMDFIAINAGRERHKALNSRPTSYCIAKGDLVMFDGGCHYHGYMCDTIRHAHVGPPTPEQKKWFEIVIEANKAATSAIKPGVSTGDIFRMVHEVFEKAGLASYASCIPVIGHGVGLEIHEEPTVSAPRILDRQEQELQSGMVLAIEPAIAGMGGDDWPEGFIIVENVVAVTDTGHELLTDELTCDLWIV